MFRVPPSLLQMTPVLQLLAPLAGTNSPALRMTEPLAATAVVAEMRPLWFTASPAREIFPRGADRVAPAWLVAVPVGRQGSAPAHGVLPLTSTIRPRMDGSVLPARNSDCPAASDTWPPG